jgi:hypothetical protein
MIEKPKALTGISMDLNLKHPEPILPSQPNDIPCLTPQQLCTLLDTHTPVLMIDLRSPQLFQQRAILHSINALFLPLVLKRLKKGMFSNFQLLHYVHGSMHRLYEEWNGRGPVVIYDEENSADVWVFAEALHKGLAKELWGSIPYYVLQGGFTHFTYDHHLTDLHQQFAQLQVQEPVLKKGTRKGLNVVIGKKNTEDGLLTARVTPPSTASPNDNAAPPEPYSRVTQHLVLGSDVLPLSPKAPELLQSIGITHLLNMAAEIPITDLVQKSPIITKWIPSLDNTEVNLDDALQDAIQFISIVLLSRSSDCQS